MDEINAHDSKRNSQSQKSGGAARDIGERVLCRNQRCRTELARWFGEKASDLCCLGIHRLAHAQFRQPPHWRDHRPRIRTTTPGLYLAGEYMQSSSINGALLSGVEAARAVLAEQR